MLIGEIGPEADLGPELGERSRDAVIEIGLCGLRRQVHREIDGGSNRRAGGGRRELPDERAAPHRCLDKARGGALPIGPRDRGEIDPKGLGQRPVRRQRLPWRSTPASMSSASASAMRWYTDPGGQKL